MKSKYVSKNITSSSLLMIVLLIFTITACQKENISCVVKPVGVTDTVKWDSDDPAIWINPDDPSKSLILGTDKETDGALYVFDLKGKVIEEKTVRNLKRPNNVDVEYGFMLNGESLDIAVVTEREANKIRIFSLPDMRAIDKGGIEVFDGDEFRAPMGVSLYKRNSDGSIYVILSRKEGPLQAYLWQYLLVDGGDGYVTGTVVRKFGDYSGLKEIESIAVDDQLGYIYYSDEQFGVRKYLADPDAPNADEELGIIYTKDYLEDNEGISIYCIDDKTGYILVSDQSANRFRIYSREGTPAIIDPEDPEDNEPARPHIHKLVKIVDVSTNNSDGSEVTSIPLGPDFPAGLFVAMSDDKTFQIYSWEDIIGNNVLSTGNTGE